MTREAAPEFEASYDDMDEAGYMFDYDFEGIYEEEEFKSLGLHPSSPTGAKPGSEEKVIMLAARYAAGLPLWHRNDCADHGPAETDVQGHLADA